MFQQGRRNWNIPSEQIAPCLSRFGIHRILEHMAEFKIDSSDDGLTTIAVSHPGTPTPFFRVTVQPIPVISWLPIPFHSSTALIQPPLPAGKNPEEVATTQWCQMPSTVKGILHAVWVMPGLEGSTGDGAGFPAVVPWSVGVYVHENNIYCPASTFLDMS